jgi:hypothetical protein
MSHLGAIAEAEDGDDSDLSNFLGTCQSRIEKRNSFAAEWQLAAFSVSLLVVQICRSCAAVSGLHSGKIRRGGLGGYAVNDHCRAARLRKHEVQICRHHPKQTDSALTHVDQMKKYLRPVRASLSNLSMNFERTRLLLPPCLERWRDAV